MCERMLQKTKHHRAFLELRKRKNNEMLFFSLTPGINFGRKASEWLGMFKIPDSLYQKIGNLCKNQCEKMKYHMGFLFNVDPYLSIALKSKDFR